MIDEILKFSAKHPKGVILALLTVIAAGGIAGGLWIQVERGQVRIFLLITFPLSAEMTRNVLSV